MKSIIIGIAGGTGSGKTTIAKNIVQEYGPGEVLRLDLDSYYRDLSDLSREERAKINFDHPSSLEIELLVKHVDELCQGKTVQIPIYNFATHNRAKDTRKVEPHKVIIIEGIMALYYPELIAKMDVKLYVDTPSDIRFIRRLKRDIIERGRSVDSVIDQYKATVRPMHSQFVEPNKYVADVIIPEGGMNHVAVDLIRTKINAVLKEKHDV
ncbi:MAG: uridine kinase [Candidatus Marinimicrobia bacterium]|jgi:uridine kinase|nr:uridine kinase [Candidatus Neomarinimicrobiota bacterium]MBT4361776.1 uridine kinase [Candidatus Neomarinimicrobiota bacterium]MBT4714468.1 uridine kinase [Candidatus Neomarinimicrobiota bacterium]MBT4946169.1 uridine kinase [Candidatus Neomarinimicrobiota bacterium]MBT5268968.1 uridine kinase [Candidatus Neomarinimicrobiota bacterium]